MKSPVDRFCCRRRLLSNHAITQQHRELDAVFGPTRYVPKQDEMANLDPLPLPVGALAKLVVTESKLDRSKRGDVVMKADAILLTAINAHPK